MSVKTSLPAVSMPQYYASQGGEHLYVIKLKRSFYPTQYPTHAGVWIGVTIAHEDRTHSKEEADRVYTILAIADIHDVQSFNLQVANIGYIMDSVD